MFLSGRSSRRAFTLIELLVVIAIIAILAAILFPVFAQARASARAITCVSNTKQVALGVLMYAQDYDETIPRHDNNGSAAYGWCPSGNCAPDWGRAGTDPNEPNAMFTGVVQPYIKNKQMLFCPEAGTPKWASVIPNGAVDGEAYVSQLDNNGIYAATYSQMAANMLLLEWTPGAVWPGGGNPPTGPIGTMASWTRPAELVLLSGDSVWDTSGVATDQGVGNMAVWPSNPGSKCANYGDPGWTWFLHRATSRTGWPFSGTKHDLGINSGRANIAMADGHVKAMGQNVLMSCDFVAAKNVWAYTYWDPRY